MDQALINNYPVSPNHSGPINLFKTLANLVKNAPDTEEEKYAFTMNVCVTQRWNCVWSGSGKPSLPLRRMAGVRAAKPAVDAALYVVGSVIGNIDEVSFEKLELLGLADFYYLHTTL